MRLLPFVLLLLAEASVSAQTAASLSGTVQDPQGAVVRNAEITLFDRPSGQTHKTASDTEGAFRLED